MLLIFRSFESKLISNLSKIKIIRATTNAQHLTFKMYDFHDDSPHDNPIIWILHLDIVNFNIVKKRHFKVNNIFFLERRINAIAYKHFMIG